MSTGLVNLRKRIEFAGGNVDGRFDKSKLLSLQQAIKNSYQSETIILEDGRSFKCLINHNKLSEDYEEKEISIPFQAQCLETGIVEEVGIKSGDIFEWKKNQSHWMVYLPVSEETAYFRASVKKCQYELEIGDKKFWVHIRGPVEQTLSWSEQENIYFNSLNYTLILTIQNTEETRKLFKRFKKVKVKNMNWEVQAADDFSLDSIITVYLKEDFSNDIKEEYEKEQAEKIPEIIPPEENEIYIEGEQVVYPFDKKTYYIKNISGGIWKVSDTKKAIIKNQTDEEVAVEVISVRSGNFDLIYKRESEDDVVLHITIDSL